MIESPFGSKDPAIVEENKKYLDQCIADSLELGEAPYASHKLYPGALDDNIPLQREKGMAAGFAWGEKAEYVAVYVDRGISNGMVEGIKRAEANGLHVEFRSLKLERRLG